MIKFFSNHDDTKELERITGEKVEVISHPYIEPEWTIEDVEEKCGKQIREAVDAEKLVINGDYTLVSMITIKRFLKGKKTGFIGMKKLNKPTNEKDKDGNIVHKNILKPVNVRWIKGGK